MGGAALFLDRRGGVLETDLALLDEEEGGGDLGGEGSAVLDLDLRDLLEGPDCLDEEALWLGERLRWRGGGEWEEESDEELDESEVDPSPELLLWTEGFLLEGLPGGTFLTVFSAGEGCFFEAGFLLFN